jgi:hypothetical protein
MLVRLRWGVKLFDQHSKSSFCGGGHDSVAEESEFVGAIVTGDAQLGIVQPTGRPISVSTQRGFSRPAMMLAVCSGKFCPRDSHCLQASGVVAPLWSQFVGVAHNPWRLPSVLGLAGAAWPWSCMSATKLRP